MKFEPWIGYASSRYISSRRRDKSSPSSVLAVLGICTGVLALIVIIAVMNGFQMGFIESILEISSFHIRVELPGEDDEAVLDKVRALGGVRSVLPFREIQALLRGKGGGPQVAMVRALPENTASLDRGMAEKLVFESGSFDLSAERSILLGAELARRLSVGVGDEVSVISVSGLVPDEMETGNTPFTVAGIFRSGFYEYDLGWAIINIEETQALQGVPETLYGGIKLHNRFQDERALKALSGLGVYNPVSWREYNRAFFGALRMEKLLMFVLVGLIFIVVGLNIYQSQRRFVLERREEIGLLRAVGAGERAVRLVFTYDGFIIGFLGAGLGLALGLPIAFNIGPFFSILETTVNAAVHALNLLASALTGGAVQAGTDFAIFSPAVFYIKEVPSRVIPHEVLLICLFGLLSATGAAWLASGRISRIKPAEVLRYE
ncbi:MAG: ABC transporter permease [Spirochaetaceae bacterium]|nr:ABC transporter permease [Spirochaetaceae bacterium]